MGIQWILSSKSTTFPQKMTAKGHNNSFLLNVDTEYEKIYIYSYLVSEEDVS